MTSSDTDLLLDHAGAGEAEAVHLLLNHHRERLKKMVAVRMDRRLSTRVDPSDVVQETLIVAERKLPEYLRDRPVAFYPWLRKIAWERLLDLRRRHVLASRRSVNREAANVDGSQHQLIDHFARSVTGPLQRLARRELHDRIRIALDRLSSADREVLVLRMLEQLPVRQVAEIMNSSDAAVKQRQARALERMRRLLDDEV